MIEVVKGTGLVEIERLAEPSLTCSRLSRSLLLFTHLDTDVVEFLHALELP